jgi:RNA polymerase sigma-70 factor (sigma-E family)
MDEPDGFREYVSARQRTLLRSAWLLTGDWASAEDIVQVALMKVWPRWSHIIATGDPDGYVRRAVLTTFLSARRRRWTGEYATAELPEYVAPGDAYAAVEHRDQLVRALRRLGRRQRAVLVLRYVEDLTDAQVADLMGCSVATVRSQASRALAAIRAEWAADTQPMEVAP